MGHLLALKSSSHMVLSYFQNTKIPQADWGNTTRGYTGNKVCSWGEQWYHKQSKSHIVVWLIVSRLDCRFQFPWSSKSTDYWTNWKVLACHVLPLGKSCCIKGGIKSSSWRCLHVVRVLAVTNWQGISHLIIICINLTELYVGVAYSALLQHWGTQQFSNWDFLQVTEGQRKGQHCHCMNDQLVWVYSLIDSQQPSKNVTRACWECMIILEFSIETLVLVFPFPL